MSMFKGECGFSGFLFLVKWIYFWFECRYCLCLVDSYMVYVYVWFLVLGDDVVSLGSDGYLCFECFEFCLGCVLVLEDFIDVLFNCFVLVGIMVVFWV